MARSVIVPLYVYPTVGAWDPVFDMATSYPQVQFTAVVNVLNGPGDDALPNAEYSDAIGTLNSFNNIRAVGYVATTWCSKNLSTVLDEVAAYSYWGETDDSLAMSGIFVDETPTQYSQQYVSYLQSITQAVQESAGLKDGFVVHNPGALPAAQYFSKDEDESVADPTADLTIVFENSFANWTAEESELAARTEAYDRSKLALLVHSVPELTDVDMEGTLLQMLAVGHSIWLTGTTNYTEFDTQFPAFLGSLDTLLSQTITDVEDSELFP